MQQPSQSETTNETMKDKYSITPDQESKIVSWFKTRGGVAVWENQDLSSASIGCLSFIPATRSDGAKATTPSWQCGSEPVEIVTDQSRFEVVTYSEFRRVKVRTGPHMHGGLHRLDKNKVYNAMDEAGEGAVWIPDYDRQYGSPWWTAVVKKLDGTRPLNMEVA